jgi:hypothetical protein
MIGYIIKPGIDINENNNKINDFLEVHLKPQYTDQQKLIQVNHAVNKFNYEFVYCLGFRNAIEIYFMNLNRRILSAIIFVIATKSATLNS